ncbi:hypothetical protein [Georgenia deserti]|uniref:Polysaccharide deacetylase family protein n=1 Tax=Georgenia deserti TaxID=2093781 RepID=A0ABW4L160_9MICO
MSTHPATARRAVETTSPVTVWTASPPSATSSAPTGVDLGTLESVEGSFGRYLVEILAHAGIATATSTPATDLPDRGVVVATTVADRAVETLETWVAAGGTLILTAGPTDLGDLAGARETHAVGTGRVTVAEHPFWTHRPPRHLRAVRGAGLDPAPGTDVLATWQSGEAAICARRHGDGMVITFGVDLAATVVLVQQGVPVTGDGVPARDGTAPVDDDILKAEDGMTLDLEHDRALPPGEGPVPESYTHTYPPPAAVPIFDQPHADWWRSLLLQAIWAGTERTGTVVPWLGYWPAGLSAIAHMSHDADQNVPEDGRAALDAFAEADVSVTWCQVFPGGYGQEIYDAITAAGHEHALHYNAMGDADIASWGWPQFRAQYAWAQAVTGREDIVANKNHYTRWEGWTEFYRWCEEVGIEIDESRGPSKQGTVGFPFGTAHVSFPLAPPESGRSVHDVLNLPLHTQDLAWAAHASVRDVILDAAEAQHGVAHFLFHGPHLNRRPATRAACVELAAEARRRGMEWWTAEQINAWERARRAVRLTAVRRGGTVQVDVESEAPLEAAAILVPVDAGAPPSLARADHGATLEVTTVRRHGRVFAQLAVDVRPGTTRWELS